MQREGLSMRSLRLNIILITLVMLCLTLTVTVLITVRAFKTYYTEALTAKSEVFGQNVRSIVQSLLRFGVHLDQLEGMNNQLAELLAHAKGVAYAHIYNAQGALLYTTDAPLAQRLAFPHLPPDTFAKALCLTQQHVTGQGEVYYDTAFPVLSAAGELRGTLRVGFPAVAVAEKITPLLLTAATILGGAFLVAAAIFLAFSMRHITRPISRLLSATQALARGDFSHTIAGMPDNELGALATGFNQMAAQLRGLITELEARNDFARAIISTRDLEAILRLVVERAAASGPYDCVRLYLHEAPRHLLVCRAATGLAEACLPQEPLALAEDDAGVVARVFAQHTPYGAEALAVVPLCAGDKALGVLTVEQCQGRQPLSPERLQALVAFANTAALALDNALLYQHLEERVRERTRQLEMANEQLQSLDRAKSDFLSTVSHELRTPLTSILGFSKMLAKRFHGVLLPHLDQQEAKVRREAERVQENLGIIVEEGERLTRLINDVLDLAKIESGKVAWRLAEVSLLGVVQSSIQAAAALAHEKRLTVRLVTRGEALQVLGDHDRLVQVVTNLLSNAIKFTPAGEITCVLAQQETQVLLQVMDTGVGIAPQELARVFEKFTQAGNTLTEKPHGTGLGLAICREIVAWHGGTIWAESEPGQGSVFGVTLPALSPPVASVGVTDQ